MSKDFTFKQFNITQKNAAFKVGTDSVVLGAWANISASKNILDIGTGTGLLALMCAQRNQTAKILAIEKEGKSAEDAALNFSNSLWKNRLKVENTSLENYHPNTSFDYIICNPPYFLNALLPPDQRKANARHVSENWFSILAEKINLLAHENGIFGCVLPQKEFDFLHKKLLNLNWKLARTQKLYPYPGGEKIRVLAEWKKDISVPIYLGDLFIRNEAREFDHTYRLLCQDFYLNF